LTDNTPTGPLNTTIYPEEVVPEPPFWLSDNMTLVVEKFLGL
jgi:hypothetical protein